MAEAPKFSPEALRRARRAAGMSRDKLAVSVGCSSDQVGRYERGEGVPTFNLALAMAHALQVHVSVLATEPE